jgi:uncharacterized repeat protein (TIGR03803 family)
MRSCHIRCVLISLLALLAALAAAQPVLRDLHDFGSSADGGGPRSGPVFDKAGNMYGTGQAGGAYGHGIVWEFTPSGLYTVLHSFGGTVTNANGQSGPDGNTPWAGVMIDAAGNLYGTTACGGPNASNQQDYAGNVWEITSAGVYEDLHDFGGQVTNADGSPGPDGTGSTAAPTLDSAGNLYGTASGGGPNALPDGSSNPVTGSGCGIVWEITASGAYLDLHDFGGQITTAEGTQGLDGCMPYRAGVTIDEKGNLYGTAFEAGPFHDSNGVTDNTGMVWEITAAGTYKDLHDFDGFNGYWPNSSVIFDPLGNMYGTSAGAGTVWKISSSGVFSLFYVFAAQGTGAPNPNGLIMDSHGNLYGTTMIGGASGWGEVWEVSPSGVATDLYDLPASAWTWSGVALDPSGNIYGNASAGGQNGLGMVWCLTTGLTGVASSNSKVTGGAKVTATISLKGPASYDAVVQLGSNSSNATVPAQILVKPGAKTATFTIQTSAVTGATPVTLSASYAGKKETATLTLNPPAVASLHLEPSTVYGGAKSTGTVTLNGPAPAGGTTVSLTGGSSAATMPGSVSVAAGQTSATFTIVTKAVAKSVSDTIEATTGSTSDKAVLTIEAPKLAWLGLNPATVFGGDSMTGTVKLWSIAPAGGFVVSLASSSTMATPPATITVPAGSASVAFPVKTVPVVNVITGTIRAQAGTVSESASFKLNPASLASLTLSPTSVKGGTSSIGTVTLGSPAPTGGLSVVLSSTSSAATLPGTVIVAAGMSKATFTVKTTSVKTQTSATIKAALSGVTKSATLVIKP